MTGYTRQSSIVNGDIGDASLWNAEYDQLVAAFAAAGGHKHDGSVDGGALIEASDVPYDPASSGLTAVTTQAAVDEVEGRVDSLEGVIIAGPVQSVAGATGIVTLADIGLENVDNTSDLNKPVSTATTAAITAAIASDTTLAQTQASVLSF